MIQHNKPTIGSEEIQAMERVLKSGWVAQGKEVEMFEQEFSSYLGLGPGQAAAVSSGTAALYIALHSLGIGPGDEVIAPSYVCSAVLNAINFCGAAPVLVDVNADDLNISFDRAKEKLCPMTKAIIVPHIFGMPADIDKFLALGVPIIEDCAQAIGAKFDSHPVGTFGQAAIFSFYASKVLTTGYGGMVISKHKEFIEKVKDFREFDCRKEYKPRFNFQMSDIQAAMGRAQIKKLPQFLEKRKKIANEYYAVVPSAKAWPSPDNNSKEPNFYRFLTRAENPAKLMDFMAEKGIKTIIPIENYELLHRYLKIDAREFPNSEHISKTMVSIPVYPSLTNLEISTIRDVLANYHI